MTSFDSINQTQGRIPTLETPRLILRPAQFGDEQAVFELCSQPEVGEFTTVPEPYTMEEAQKYIARMVFSNLDPNGKNWEWRICLKETGQPIGGCGFSLHTENMVATIGYILDRNFWGQGLVPEAVAKIISYGFETQPQLAYFKIPHLVGNPKSGRVAQKLGFTFEGISRGHLFTKGVLHDSFVYSLSRAERESLKNTGFYS